MPDDYSAAWNTAAQTVSQAGQVVAQAKLNKKTREWNEMMADRQRSWALEDWNRQNAYNLPSAQMARLKDAGLNPNLVYGSGNVVATASTPVRGTDVKSWAPSAPDMGKIGTSLMSYYQIQMSQAQLDNMKVQNQVLQQEALNKQTEREKMQADIGVKSVTAETMGFDLQFKKDMRSTDVNTKIAALDKIVADTKFTLNQDERNAASNAQSLRKGVEEILNLRATRGQINATTDQIRAYINNLEKDGMLKDFEIALSKKGLTKSDPYYLRAIGVLADQGQFTPKGDKLGGALDSLEFNLPGN